MKKQLEQRLKSLKNEFESGKQAMQELETKQASLRDTLLRISGAIQVLEEELVEAEESNDQLPIEVESLPITNSHDS